MPFEKICFWAVNIGNDEKENPAILYMIDFLSLLASLVGQTLSLDTQVSSGLGGRISGWVDHYARGSILLA